MRLQNIQHLYILFNVYNYNKWVNRKLEYDKIYLPAITGSEHSRENANYLKVPLYINIVVVEYYLIFKFSCLYNSNRVNGSKT